MSTYPVVYEQMPAVKRSRLTVFFRIIMVIPHFVVSFFYGIAAWIGVVLAWVAIVVTGRYPQGLYNFVAGYLRFTMRLSAYMYLVTDAFPPFNGGEHPEYSVRLYIPQRQDRYSRLKTFFRFILFIPVAILLYIFLIWIEAVSIALWFVGVIVGKTPTGLSGASGFPLAYVARAYAYGFLLTDRWPPLDD
jgi:hypothetical protein